MTREEEDIIIEAAKQIKRTSSWDGPSAEDQKVLLEAAKILTRRGGSDDWGL